MQPDTRGNPLGGIMAGPVAGIAAWLTVRAFALREQRERGDMPGWVLITVMTAGIVVALWAIAGPQLKSMLNDALNSVKGP